MANPFLDNAFHIHWSRLVPAAIELDNSAALDEAQAAIDKLAAPLRGDATLTF